MKSDTCLENSQFSWANLMEQAQQLGWQLHLHLSSLDSGHSRHWLFQGWEDGRPWWVAQRGTATMANGVGGLRCRKFYSSIFQHLPTTGMTLMTNDYSLPGMGWYSDRHPIPLVISHFPTIVDWFRVTTYCSHKCQSFMSSLYPVYPNFYQLLNHYNQRWISSILIHYIPLISSSPPEVNSPNATLHSPRWLSPRCRSGISCTGDGFVPRQKGSSLPASWGQYGLWQ